MSALKTTPLELIEKKVSSFLQYHSKDDYTKNIVAPNVAKKSLMMNHLYQDLGFKSRVEMNRFMKEHFPTLSIQKPANKLWKKYIYDLVNEVAPACATCPDKINCFVCRA
jgi:nitrogen fixation protein NifQ